MNTPHIKRTWNLSTDKISLTFVTKVNKSVTTTTTEVDGNTVKSLDRVIAVLEEKKLYAQKLLADVVDEIANLDEIKSALS